MSQTGPFSSASLRAHVSPPLCSSAPPSSLPCPLLVLWLSLPLLLISVSILGRNVGELPQTLAWHAGVVNLVALAFRSLTRRRSPAFAAGFNGRTLLSFWSRSVSRRRRPLLFPLVLLISLDWSAYFFVGDIFVFDSFYFYRECLWRHVWTQTCTRLPVWIPNAQFFAQFLMDLSSPSPPLFSWGGDKLGEGGGRHPTFWVAY